MSKQEKLVSATHEGELNINDIKIKSYNLDNGERVLSRIGFLKALGRTGKAKGGREFDEEFKTPVFLSATNLKSFISNDLIENSKPIHFRDLNGNKSIGYKAALLPSVCYVFIDASKAGKLKANQKHIAERCEVLIRGFATVGIIALIDEATGYQYDRERKELQKILEAYISKELLPWQRKFPDTFYKELFRLNGWDFTVKGIKKRPGVIGTWTNKLIYEQLPKGVLNQLKKITPKGKGGKYSARFHQSLTTDVGNPHLSAQLNQIIALFMLSDNMKHMWHQFEKLKQRQSGQLELPFNFDDQGHTIEPVYEKGQLSSYNKKLKTALEYNPKEKTEN